MIEIDFEYIEKRKINKDELLARELLNISATIRDEFDSAAAFKVLNKVEKKHFELAFKILSENDNHQLKDMAMFETLISNILSTPIIEDEEDDEIYV